MSTDDSIFKAVRLCGNGHEVADDGFAYCPACGERLSDVSAPQDMDAAESTVAAPMPEPAGSPADNVSDTGASRLAADFA
ncbi:MAG TPA: hypothetical protein VIM30_12535 [Candidatus Limnocylindrales bacterium]|jgi:uncharacterized protein with PIN domain